MVQATGPLQSRVFAKLTDNDEVLISDAKLSDILASLVASGVDLAALEVLSTAINAALQAGGVTQTQLAALLTGITLAGTTITKTIETELIGITEVAADIQSVSSVLALTNMKQATILIDHAKDNAAASVGQGTEYVIQVSEKATGNDTWRALASFTAAITVPIAVVTDAAEAIGQTVIEIGAVIPAVGDIVFFKNGTLANSEWSTIIAVLSAGAASTFTIQDALTSAQGGIGSTYYTQGEHFVITVDVSSKTRMRVVCNNTKGTTNRAIVWRCACITSA